MAYLSPCSIVWNNSLFRARVNILHDERIAKKDGRRNLGDPKPLTPPPAAIPTPFILPFTHKAFLPIALSPGNPKRDGGCTRFRISQKNAARKKAWS